MLSEAERDALLFAARERDFIADFPHCVKVEALKLKSGKWRAYLRAFVTPGSPRGQQAESKEVVRDLFGNIITANSRTELVGKLREEYPGRNWD